MQVVSHKNGVEGKSNLPQHAGPTSSDAARDTGGFLGCKHILTAHTELLVNQHPQVFLFRAVLNPFSTHPVFMLGIAQLRCILHIKCIKIF